MIYLDETTGEDLKAWQEGCATLPEEPAEASQNDAEWLGDWYTKKIVQIEAERRALREQYKLRMAQLDSRENGLRFAWGERLERVVADDLIGSKRRSINYGYGTCGFRRSKKVEVTDKDAAIEWAEDYCPEAVKVTSSLLKSELPKDQEIPGVERIEKDEFFVRAARG